MKNLLIIYGCNSTEYDVSVKTFKSVLNCLENSNKIKETYKLHILHILPDNTMIFNDQNIFQIGNSKINNIYVDLAFLTTHGGSTVNFEHNLIFPFGIQLDHLQIRQYEQHQH